MDSSFLNMFSISSFTSCSRACNFFKGYCSTQTGSIVNYFEGRAVDFLPVAPTPNSCFVLLLDNMYSLRFSLIIFSNTFSRNGSHF